MIRIKSIRAFVVIALASVAALSATAQQPTDNENRDRIISELKPYKHKFIAKELELSKEQQREFFSLYDKMDDELQKINDETRQLEKNVSDNTNATDTEIEAASRAVFEQKQKEAEVEMAYFDRFKNVLTPRQLLKLKNSERRFTQWIMRHHRKMSRERADSDKR